MRSLYFEGRPFDFENEKEQEPLLTTVAGGPVYCSEVLPALLRYGTFDHYFLPEIPKKYREEAFSLPEIGANANRISFIPEHSYHLLRESETLCFVTPNSSLRDLARIRRTAQRYDSPITGVIHSLNFNSFVEEVLLEMLSPLASFDALFVSSTAGSEALRKLIGVVQLRLRTCFHLELPFPPKQVHMPLGVNAALYERRDGDSIEMLRATYQLPIDSVVILYFGRFSPVSKGDLLPLMMAFARMPQVDRKVVLVLAGDDSQLRIAGQLREFAVNLGCARSLHIFENPSRPQKQDLYKLADVFVSPSDCIQETFGITLIEAMAASLPVVASDWSGYRDIVVPGKTGYLIPTVLPEYPHEFDILRSSGMMTADDLLARTTIVSIPHLQQALYDLSGNRELRRRLGDAGHDRVKRLYDWRCVIAGYESTWDELAREAKHESSEQRVRLTDFWDPHSYSEIFGHYATRGLSATDLVGLTSAGADETRRGFVVRSMADPQDRFEATLFEALLGELAIRRPVAVGDLVKRVQTDRDLGLFPLDAAGVTLVHLSRMIKYGLVCLV